MSVRLADSLSDWDGYFEAYIDSLRRSGTKGDSAIPGNSSTPWLNGMTDEFAFGSLIRANCRGALCFDGRRVVHYWHGAAFQSSFEARPVNLLLDTAIADGVERGSITLT